MRDEDRILLTEYATSICYTHPFAALALHRAAVDANDVAIVTESLVRGIDRTAAAIQAESDGTAGLMQRHVVARLLAQLAAALEDCGALGDAVRYRDRDGILRRYLHSEARAVGQFWGLVESSTPFVDLIAFPALDGLGLPPEDRHHLEAGYEGLGRFLRDAADVYRGQNAPGTWSVGGSGTAEEAGFVHIVVDIVSPDPTGNPPRAGVSLLEAYNKIKHRFAVFDRIADLGAAVGSTGDVVLDARYPVDSTHAGKLVDNVFNVARASGEMAAITLKLDELGVLPGGL